MHIGTPYRLVFTAIIIFCLGAVKSPASEKAKNLTLSKALSQVKLLADLTKAEKDALKTAATIRQGKAGELLIRQGKTSGKMFIILEGNVEVKINGKFFVTLSGQPLVGEIEFLDGLPATADVLLREKTNVIEIDNAALNKLMEKQPRIGYVIMREIAKIEAQRLRNTSTKKILNEQN